MCVVLYSVYQYVILHVCCNIKILCVVPLCVVIMCMCTCVWLQFVTSLVQKNGYYSLMNLLASYSLEKYD